MKPTVIVCLFMLTLTFSAGPDIRSASNAIAPAACSLSCFPKLQAYYLKKVKKEKLQCAGQANVFKRAIDNSLYFIVTEGLDKLLPVLKN